VYACGFRGAARVRDERCWAFLDASIADGFRGTVCEAILNVRSIEMR